MFLISTRVPKGSRAARPKRHVGFDAHLAALHVRVGCADRAQQELQLLGVAAGLLGCTDVGLGDDLHQRRAGAVEVDEAHLRSVRTGRVDELGGVLLEMGAGDPDGERALGSFRRSASPRDASGRSYWLIW